MATTTASAQLGPSVRTASVHAGGEPYPFNGRPKALPLLPYLLLHRAGLVGRDSLAFALWDSPYGRFGHCERANEVSKVVSQSVKLEANRVRIEGSTRKPRPLDRAFALFYPLLSRPALVVEPDDVLRRIAQIRDYESNARELLPGVPLHLGDNPARMGPTRRLVVEALVEPLHVVRGTPDRPLEQITDSRLENLIRLTANQILQVCLWVGQLFVAKHGRDESKKLGGAGRPVLRTRRHVWSVSRPNRRAESVRPGAEPIVNPSGARKRSRYTVPYHLSGLCRRGPCRHRLRSRNGQSLVHLSLGLARREYRWISNLSEALRSHGEGPVGR